MDCVHVLLEILEDVQNNERDCQARLQLNVLLMLWVQILMSM